MGISRSLVIASGTALAGVAVAIANMVGWSYIQSSLVGNPDSGARVLDFFVAQAVATVLVVTSLFAVYRTLASRRSLEIPSSLLSVVGEALASRRAIRLGLAAGFLYAVVYSFLSSFIVYQPGVDFGKAYGASQPGWSYVACCGDAGTVPTLSVYLSPALHLGMELVPLTLLFLFLIPLLVGFNAVTSFYALRISSFPLRGRWLASSGAVIGLFTACPTCAGLFFASSLGTAGTTLALALAPFQVLFIAVTLPVLLVGPLLTAFSVKRSYEASCRVSAVPTPG